MPTASTFQQEFWQYKLWMQYSGVHPQVVQYKLDCALVDPIQLILSGSLDMQATETTIFHWKTKETVTAAVHLLESFSRVYQGLRSVQD